MLMSLFSILAPDYCCNCRKVGSILCESCLNDIVLEPFGRCLQCLSPTASSNLCANCRRAFKGAWTAGERDGVLKELVDISKFEANRRGCAAQAKLLDRMLPSFPQGVTIVPVPTIAPHIRRRGYDHMAIVARELSRRRGWPVAHCLKRKTAHVQHGADKPTRLKQANEAFYLQGEPPDTPLLLLDDVYTTGATLAAAARTLRSGSKQPIYAAVTTRQLLD